MGFEHILVERSGEFATVTMNRPQRRNALSLEHMRELITAFRDLGDSDARASCWRATARCSAPGTTSPMWPAPT